MCGKALMVLMNATEACTVSDVMPNLLSVHTHSPGLNPVEEI